MGATHLLAWNQKSRTDKILDVIVSAFSAGYAGLYLASLVYKRNIISLGLFLFYTLLAFLFLRRKPAKRAAPWWQTVIALVSVFWPAAVLRPAPEGVWVGNVLQAVALGFLLAATLSLGRSFGIAPADRGLRTEGMYRFVRHPLYASETLFYIGYLLANLSWTNVFGLVGAVVVFIMRIRWEEQLIEGYSAYAQQVRWRLVPYVW